MQMPARTGMKAATKQRLCHSHEFAYSSTCPQDSMGRGLKQGVVQCQDIMVAIWKVLLWAGMQSTLKNSHGCSESSLTS